MRGPLILPGDGFTLRAVEARDLEDLRSWKNANKAAFFSKKEISAEDQQRWFEGYLERPDDFMFVVETRGEKAGCVGVRLKDGEADCYNIIGLGKGVMAKAMKLLCEWAGTKWGRPVSLLVVEDNDAAGFYAKCGFQDAGSGPAGSRKLTYPWAKLDMPRGTPASGSEGA